jgi:hypothetical protein
MQSVSLRNRMLSLYKSEEYEGAQGLGNLTRRP